MTHIIYIMQSLESAVAHGNVALAKQLIEAKPVLISYLVHTFIPSFSEEQPG
jgi:hypothetical protein